MITCGTLAIVGLSIILLSAFVLAIAVVAFKNSNDIVCEIIEHVIYFLFMLGVAFCVLSLFIVMIKITVQVC